GGFAGVRACMEAAWVYGTRGVGWRVAFVWTLPSWVWLLPLATAIVLLARRFFFDRRNRVQSAIVHILACGIFAIVHLVGITPFRVLLAGEPLTRERLSPALFLAFRLLFYLVLPASLALV